MKLVIALSCICGLLGFRVLGVQADPLNQNFIPISQESSASHIESGVRSISILGRERATVTRSDIRIADLAEVNSRFTRDDDAVIAIQKIVVGKSPAPGEQTTVSAQQLLEALKRSGVDVNKVGYTFPRIITVERASRAVGEDEIRSALRSFFERSGREAEVRSIQMPQNIRVAPQAIEIEPISRPSSSRAGTDTFQMVVTQEGRKVAAFDVQASLEEWREMPVAKRPLPKGSVVGPDDFMMARMNMNALPRDVAKSESGVVGLRLNQEIAPGEVFRRQHLMIPPLVEAGQRVSLMYRSKLLEATAVGVALQQGAQGDVITVKNENSKKVVSGIVTESGVVEVRP